MPKANRHYGALPPRHPSGLRAAAVVAVVLVAAAALGLWLRARAGQSDPMAASSPTAQVVAAGRSPRAALTGRAYPSQGHDHLGQDQLNRFKYNSDPPTSGPHKEIFTDTFISPSPLPKYIQVHLLEHGNVLLQYNCTCPDIAAALADIANTYNNRLLPPNELQPMPADVQNGEEQGQAVVVAPYPSMKPTVALTAWTRLATLHSVDRAAVTSFVDAYLHNSANLAQ
ncbi:MAG: DUF3105 domain-containing protein [Candidatus Eremiobacteraeota bacterium]|nr:DUF3105 domain-containing protein [Candidatus Eremiobacteraeota bacterium]